MKILEEHVTLAGLYMTHYTTNERRNRWWGGMQSSQAVTQTKAPLQKIVSVTNWVRVSVICRHALDSCFSRQYNHKSYELLGCARQKLRNPVARSCQSFFNEERPSLSLVLLLIMCRLMRLCHSLTQISLEAYLCRGCVSWASSWG